MPAAIEIQEQGLHLWQQLLPDRDTIERGRKNNSDLDRIAIRKGQNMAGISTRNPFVRKKYCTGRNLIIVSI